MYSKSAACGMTQGRACRSLYFSSIMTAAACLPIDRSADLFGLNHVSFGRTPTQSVACTTCYAHQVTLITLK